MNGIQKARAADRQSRVEENFALIGSQPGHAVLPFGSVIVLWLKATLACIGEGLHHVLGLACGLTILAPCQCTASAAVKRGDRLLHITDVRPAERVHVSGSKARLDGIGVRRPTCDAGLVLGLSRELLGLFAAGSGQQSQ